jgi:NADPH:quinone reductase-like Zn-dependent oxidoreductase
MAGGPTGRFFRLLAVGSLLTRGTDRTMTLLMWKPFAPADVATLTNLLQAGKIKPGIDRTYPLDDVPEAIRCLESGAARGKLVIRIASNGGVR